MGSEKCRLDKYLAVHYSSLSDKKRRGLLLSGNVLVNERPETSGAVLVAPDDIIRVRYDQYVSRGGVKLAGALKDFAVHVSGMIAADVGASTGGFTDCLLQSGAERVFCIDVGPSQLHSSLRQDSRVVVYERTNARYLKSDLLAERCDIIVMDVSFISVKRIIPALFDCLHDNGILIVLVKPQFEAPAKKVPNGIVRSRAVIQEVLTEVYDRIEEGPFTVADIAVSSIRGRKGNREFFMLLKKKSSYVLKPEPVNISRFFERITL